MNELKSNTGAPSNPTLYVVTRDGRRTTEENYPNEWQAREEADYWRNLVRKYDPRSRISIAKTDKPRRVR